MDDYVNLAIHRLLSLDLEVVGPLTPQLSDLYLKKIDLKFRGQIQAGYNLTFGEHLVGIPLAPELLVEFARRNILGYEAGTPHP